MLNLVDCVPAGIVMLFTAGLATAGSLLESETRMFPGAAGNSSTAVPMTDFPPTTRFGLSPTRAIPIGRTRRIRLFVAPLSVADSVPLVMVETGIVWIGKRA